jgi:hypothetical protein
MAFLRGLLALFTTTVAATPVPSSPLDVSLWAPWPTFPGAALAEAGDFLQSQPRGAALFWDFFEAVRSQLSADPALAVSGEHAVLSRVALSAARPLVSTLVYDVLRLSLAVRALSPALEMTRQLGIASPARAACSSSGGAVEEAWAEYAGGVACSPAELHALVAAPPAAVVPFPRTYPGDHEYPLGASRSSRGGRGGDDGAALPPPLLVVWGTFTGSLSAALHSAAVDEARRGAVRYVWRTFLGSLSETDGRDVSSEGFLPQATTAGPIDEDDEPQALPSQVTWLAGYGVSLDVKSTEYKAVDERAPSPHVHESSLDEAGSTPREVDDPTIPPSWRVALLELRSGRSEGTSVLSPSFSRPAIFDSDRSSSLGINATRVATQGRSESPALASAAAKLDRILSKGGTPAPDAIRKASSFAAFSEGALTPWEMGDLSLQAAAFVMDAVNAPVDDADDPLARLVTVTANFPSLARFLSRLPVPTQLRAEAHNNSRRMAGPVTAALSVNGISIDPSAPTYNLFSLLNVLSAEASCVEQLNNLPLSLQDRRRVQALSVPAAVSAAQKSLQQDDDGSDDSSETGVAASDVIRIDVWVDDADAVLSSARPHPHPVVHWLNDVSDTSSPESPYRGMPASLNGLLRPSWQLHPIALNLYSVILIGDLSTLSSLRGLATAGFISQVSLEQYCNALCVGVIFVVVFCVLCIRVGPGPYPFRSRSPSGQLYCRSCGALSDRWFAARGFRDRYACLWSADRVASRRGPP